MWYLFSFKLLPIAFHRRRPLYLRLFLAIYFRKCLMLNCILYRVMISRFQKIFILSRRTVSMINRVHIGYQTTVLINMIYSIVKVLQNKQLSEEAIKNRFIKMLPSHFNTNSWAWSFSLSLSNILSTSSVLFICCVRMEWPQDRDHYFEQAFNLRRENNHLHLKSFYSLPAKD